VHRDDRAAQRVIPGQQVAHPMRETEHPLAHGDRREDVIHQMRGAVGHPAAAAAWAEAAPLAGKGHEAVQTARAASESREATGQKSARQELAKFLLDEPGEPFAAARTLGLGQERLEMFQHDPVQRALRGRLRFVGGGSQGHGGEHRPNTCQRESIEKPG